MKVVFLYLVLSMITFSFQLLAKELRFALVPKNTDNAFYDNSHAGCLAAAESMNVKCIYRGPKNNDVRLQNIIINQLIADKVDGIAIAVNQSEFLADRSIKNAIKAGIPIITFDADFDGATLKKYPKLRLAYIGSDNFKLGQTLAYELKKKHPMGGELIIQTGQPNSPNLQERLMGFRSVFKNDNTSTPLLNDSGWKEVRTPYKSYGLGQRARAQLSAALWHDRYNIDAFVALGGWSQFDEQRYKNIFNSKNKKIENKQVTIIIADTQPSQLSLLKQGYADVNIGQNSYQMGFKAIEILSAIVNKLPYKEINFVPLNYCTQLNYDNCTNTNINHK